MQNNRKSADDKIPSNFEGIFVYNRSMSESFKDMLAVGGKLNTLGRAEEIVQIVLADRSRLDELFECLFNDDAWIRMRAVDALEKVCRVHPEWLSPYIDQLLHEVAAIDQASIQWHLAEMFRKVELSPSKRQQAIDIMKRNIAKNSADWIVSSNTMETLAQYARSEYVTREEIIPLFKIQQTHHSKAVVKRATKLLDEFAVAD